MKNTLTKFNYLIIFTLVSFSFACKTEEKEPDLSVNGINYAMMVTGGTFPDETTYFMGSKDFPTGSVGTSTAKELASSGIMYKYGKFCYITTFGAPATLRKYSFDAAGKPVEVSSFIVQGLKTFGAVDFVSETEAYAASNGFGGVPKLVRFNPSTMQITSTIDLKPVQKSNATQVFYLGLTHRDNYLFMGCNYQKGFSNLADSVYVAVINKTSGLVEKVIADGRCGMIWNAGSASGFSGNSLVIDENNDIYVHGTGNGAKVPSGVVRIRNGQTTFDTSYFLDLTKATGKDCTGLLYYGNGKALTCRSEDPDSYPFDADQPSYKYYRIDLTAKTSQGELSTTIPKVFAANAFISKWDNNTAYFGVATGKSNSVFSLNIANATVKKEFDFSSGACNGFTKFN
ncbi:MAG: DUF4374 domain-containing protein [Arcicella sp.]|jgi:hypothetical protein|nr:DUF4374 domain-containing protein [Arcicella sp.]